MTFGRPSSSTTPRSVVVAGISVAASNTGAEVGGRGRTRPQRLHGRVVHVGGEQVDDLLCLLGADGQRWAGAVGGDVAERDVDRRWRATVSSSAFAVELESPPEHAASPSAVTQHERRASGR